MIGINEYDCSIDGLLLRINHYTSSIEQVLLYWSLYYKLLRDTPSYA